MQPLTWSITAYYWRFCRKEFSIIGITETWLNEQNSNCYGLTNYRSVNAFRHVKRGGGVSIYVRDGINFVVRDDLNLFNDLI